MSFRESVEQLLGRLPERVTVVEDASAFDPAVVRDGVVAFFTPSSTIGCMILRDRHTQVGKLPEPPPLWIVNHDTAGHRLEAVFPGEKQGKGEAYIMRGGAVVDSILDPGLDQRDLFAHQLRKAFLGETDAPVKHDTPDFVATSGHDRARQLAKEDMAMRIARHHRPNRAWMWFGIPIFSLGTGLTLLSFARTMWPALTLPAVPIFGKVTLMILGMRMILRGHYGKHGD